MIYFLGKINNKVVKIKEVELTLRIILVGVFKRGKEFNDTVWYDRGIG